MYRSLDPEDKGFLYEEDLRKLLKGKAGISEDDIDEMIKEYKEHLKNVKVTKDVTEDVVYYHGKNVFNSKCKKNPFYSRFYCNASDLKL